MKAQQNQIKKRWYYLINSITGYRLIAAPILIALVFLDQVDLFKWLLPLSFFTDMVDGYLARKFKVKSVMGAKLDSIADDFTVLAGFIGLFILKPEFIHQVLIIMLVLLFLYALQTIHALIKYHKLSGFHTYSAKIAALFQGLFLILVFHLHEIPYGLFYAAVITTSLDLIEENILVILLPKWEANVKGIYWVLKRKKNIRRK